MNRMIATLAATFALLAASVAAQKLYKWVDPDGNVSYHDRPPPAGSPYQVEEKRVPHRHATAAASRKTEEAARKAPVILYTASKCSSCDAARAHLQRRNVPFTEKNVETDTKAQEELKSRVGTLAVPTILVGAKVMNGYLESLLDGELDAAGYPKTLPAGGGEETTTATGSVR